MSSIELLREENLEFQFLVRGMNNSELNRFQQVLLDEVPTLAITEIQVEINTSSFEEAQLLNALAVIPFQSNSIDEIPYPEECEEVDCSIEFELNVFCDQAECEVTSADLIPTQATSVQPLYSDSLITLLQPGQQLKLKAWVNKGIGADHSVFSPIARPRFQNLVDFELVPRRFRDKSRQELKQILETCQENALVLDSRTGVYRLARPDELEALGCPASKLRIRPNNEFLFSFSSKGVLNLDLLMNLAAEIYEEVTSQPAPELIGI